MDKFTQKTCKTVRLSFGIAMGVYTVVLGALFLWQILDVYLGGKAAGLQSPYSYELVGERAGVLAAPFFVLWEIFPVKEKRKVISDPVYILNRLKKRVPAEVSGDLKEAFDFVKKEEKILWAVRAVCLAAGAAFLIYSVVYLATPANISPK